jgi:hypothetical protein
MSTEHALLIFVGAVVVAMVWAVMAWIKKRW